MHAGFEIGEGGVCAETNISQLQVALFAKDRQPAGRHHVAQEHQGKIAAFGIVQHIEPLAQNCLTLFVCRSWQFSSSYSLMIWSIGLIRVPSHTELAGFSIDRDALRQIASGIAHRQI